jgi:hypothetical protein
MRLSSVIFFLTIVLQSRAQSYNDTVSDSIINEFMETVLTSSAPYESVFNKLPKKVFYKAIHIGQANWHSKMDTAFEKKFKDLYRYDSVLSKQDFTFFKDQYYSMKDTTWNFSTTRIKLKKKYKPGYFKYSIPLFTKDFKRAILWRYYYRGPLYAYSELHIYKFENGKWVIERLVGGWMS